jgi:hypothetical protein
MLTGKERIEAGWSQCAWGVATCWVEDKPADGAALCCMYT